MDCEMKLRFAEVTSWSSLFLEMFDAVQERTDAGEEKTSLTGADFDFDFECKSPS